MSDNILSFTKSAPENGNRNDPYFGRCPVCRKAASTFLNIGPQHWLVCETDKTKWSPGYNLFSGWKEQTEADWQRNWQRLRFFREVEPVILPEDLEPRKGTPEDIAFATKLMEDWT